MFRFVLTLALIQSVSWAQSNDILGYEIEESGNMDSEFGKPATPKKTQKPPVTAYPAAPKELDFTVPTPPPTGSKRPPATGSLKMEDYYQTWNARKLRQSIGYSPLLRVVQYDRWLTPKWGFFAGFRYEKSTDSFTENRSTTYNQTTLGFTETTTFNGTRNPTQLALLVGGKNRIWQNDWLQISWGPLLMYNHGTTVSYATGNINRNVTNVNTPNDYTMTETNVGSTSNGIDPTYTLGVKMGTEFYLRWFPNISLCAEVILLNQLPLKGTQETNTMSRTYNVVAGVPQAPTAESYDTNRVYSDFGGAASTSQVGAQYFNIFGANWSIKYNW